MGGADGTCLIGMTEEAIGRSNTIEADNKQ